MSELVTKPIAVAEMVGFARAQPTLRIRLVPPPLFPFPSGEMTENGMLRFFFTRLSLVVPTFIGITLLVFVLIRLIPGDPIETMAGERGIDPARLTQLRKDYGFDQPVLVQYGLYLSRLAHGDLGRSIVTHEPVISEFRTLFPATIELSVCAILFALCLGLPAGIIAAVRRNSIFDHGVMGISLTGYSMPIFWWGLLLILLFSVQLGWTPVSGRIAVQYYIEPVTGFLLVDTLLSGDVGAFRSALSHLVLPMIVLGTVPLAVIARMTRSAMLEVLGEDYIRTARAKGLPRFRVIAIHALRNALIPVVTVIGLQVGVLFTGAILTETIFSWPGVGKWLIEGINRRDYPVLQGGTLLIGAIVMIVNLLVDVTYGLINPRIRYTR
jgi:dipeptide transport system permease protein